MMPMARIEKDGNGDLRLRLSKAQLLVSALALVVTVFISVLGALQLMTADIVTLRNHIANGDIHTSRYDTDQRTRKMLKEELAPLRRDIRELRNAIRQHDAQ